MSAVVLLAVLAAAWPYLLASLAPSTSYLLLIAYAYRHGEFGRVYPLARGLPPLLVTGFAFGLLDERITGLQLVGVVLISAGLGALVRGLTGGLFGVVAFATVLWAQSRAPLALVSAVRECSLLFGVGISVLVFRERLSAIRLGATVAATAGIILLQVR